jgi:hypothetical protein
MIRHYFRKSATLELKTKVLRGRKGPKSADFRRRATKLGQLLLAGRLGYHQEYSADAALELHAEVDRMLNALARSLKAKLNAHH